MRKFLFLISIATFFISVLFLGCQGAGVGNDIDGQADTIDSSSIEGSPLAPDIVTGESGSDQRALVSPEEQDFGPFVSIGNAASHYNSIAKVGVPDILQQMSGDPEIEEEPVEPIDVNVGNFVRVYKKGDSDKKHYENEDATETCTISGDPEQEAECRQFEAFVIPEEEGYSYSRAIFFFPEGQDGAGVDVTEVWEYADRKEVSVTVYRPEHDHVNKYLAVTDMSDELQKTSLLEDSGPYTDAGIDVDIADYDSIGFIDFTMTAADYDALADHTGSENTYLDGYPAFEKLEALHAKSVTPAEAKAVYIDPVDPEPFLGFEDRSELF